MRGIARKAERLVEEVFGENAYISPNYWGRARPWNYSIEGAHTETFKKYVEGRNSFHTLREVVELCEFLLKQKK